MFSDIVRTRSPSITTVLQGLSQEQEEMSPWITDVLKPIADVAKQYFDVQITQQQPQPVTKPTTAGISPIYLIGGGLVLWWLFKGKKKKGR